MKILKENTNEEYNKNIIIKLQKDIDVKTKEIEEERKKANEMKNNFEKMYKKKLLEEEEAKLANTVYVPERLIINKEKSELYVKIEKLRKENRKIKDEKKKLMEEKEELKKKYEDIDSELKKQKDKNNQGLQIQSKETNNLRKEKEKLKKKNEELTKQIELLNQKIATLEHQIINQPQQQNNVGFHPRARRRESSKRQSSNKPERGKEGYSSLDMYEKIKKQDEEKSQTMMKNGEKLLQDFVHFCMAKKIDIKQHLRSYDTSKNGRLTDDNFMKAFIELKTSFTENDIREIINISKPKDGGDIIIDEFIELMKKKNYSFKVKDDVEINNDNKQASKKYDLFANKPYNIDYP
jgi:chromosome segregation ATPase